MKRILILSVLILSLLFSLGAEEKSPWHYTYSTGLAVSSYNLAKEMGRWEYGFGLKSLFPNVFVLSSLEGLVDGNGWDEDGKTIPYTWSDAADDLAFSLFLGSYVDTYATYNLIRSNKKSLDVGIGAAILLSPMNLQDPFVGAFLESKVRFTWNRNKKVSGFLSIDLPLLGALMLTSDEGDKGLLPLPLMFSPEIEAIIALYGGVNVGWRFSI